MRVLQGFGRQPAILAFSRSWHGGHCCCTETETVAAADAAVAAAASVQGVSGLRSSGTNARSSETNDRLTLLVVDAGLERGRRRTNEEMRI